MVVYTFRYTTVLYYKQWFLLVVSQYIVTFMICHINNLVNSVLSQWHVSPKNWCSDHLNLPPFEYLWKMFKLLFVSPISGAKIKSVAFKLYYFWWNYSGKSLEGTNTLSSYSLIIAQATWCCWNFRWCTG